MAYNLPAIRLNSKMNEFYRNISVFLWNEGCNINSILK